MIQIELVSYDHILSEVDLQVTKYVNKNLQDIIRVLIDMLENDPEYGLEDFFPRDYLTRKPAECRNTINELYEIICSRMIRHYIKPKYEYLLYMILKWWKDCTDDEEDLLLNRVDNDLASKLEELEQLDVLEEIQDFDQYFVICFQDLDFLPDTLNQMVMIYLQNPAKLSLFLNYDDLDDYVDLMDCDLRERYLEARTVQKKQQTQLSNAENVVKELLDLLNKYQKRIVDFKDRDEVKITADIQDAIGNVLNSKYGLHIAREYTMGRSEKKIGETDLYIYKEVDGWVEDCVIIENKYIEKFDRQYDQLIGYLNCNFEAGITLSMNRNKSLKEGFDIIERKLHEKRQNAEVQCPPVSIERIEKGNVRYIVSEHIVPETKEKMKLYHLIFQLNDDERHKAAINARK